MMHNVSSDGFALGCYPFLDSNEHRKDREISEELKDKINNAKSYLALCYSKIEVCDMRTDRYYAEALGINQSDIDNLGIIFQCYVDNNEMFFDIADLNGNIIQCDERLYGFELVGPFVKYQTESGYFSFRYSMNYIPLKEFVEHGFNSEIKYLNSGLDVRRYNYILNKWQELKCYRTAANIGVRGNDWATNSVEYNTKSDMIDTLYMFYSKSGMKLCNMYGQQIIPDFYDTVSKVKSGLGKIKFGARISKYKLSGIMQIANDREDEGVWVNLEYDLNKQQLNNYGMIELSITASALITGADKYSDGSMDFRYQLVNATGQAVSNEYIKILKTDKKIGNQDIFKAVKTRNSKGYEYITSSGYMLATEDLKPYCLGNTGLFMTTRQTEHGDTVYGVWDGINHKFIQREVPSEYNVLYMAGHKVFTHEYNKSWSLILGNDGKLYRNIEEAFDVYKGTVKSPRKYLANEIYIVNLYNQIVYLTIGKYDVLPYNLSVGINKYNWTKMQPGDTRDIIKLKSC